MPAETASTTYPSFYSEGYSEGGSLLLISLTIRLGIEPFFKTTIITFLFVTTCFYMAEGDSPPPPLDNLDHPSKKLKKI